MTVGYIISFFILLGGLIYFLYPRYEAYFVKRPKLVIEISSNEGFTKLSKFIRYHPDTDRTKPVNRPEVIKIYRLEWRFDLTIRNNSEINAFTVKMLQHRNLMNLSFNKEINPQKSLKSHQEEIIPFQFIKTIESTDAEFESHYTNIPSDFKDLMLLLEYENQYGKKFYSRYFFNTDSTKFIKVKKTELKYWR
ncbi:hypothetical protein [Aquimarina rubra]|uniref:Uncharacterized protein n=1 Tax=Aquimarina rubra TaxID=1920033 RepID=A0ABW5LLS6_9FLAO